MPAASPPTTSSALRLRDFSDRLSPMLVKELRQGLRARAFVASLIGLHWLLLLLMAGTQFGVDRAAMNELFWGVAILALMLALPLRGFVALAGEAADGTLDLLTLTSMPAFRIVSGKWTSLFSQSLLVAGSLLPYLVARYEFGGVEIAREALALSLLVLASALTTAAFVAFSSQRSLILRLFLTAAVIVCGFPLAVWIYVVATQSPGDSVMRSFTSMTAWEFIGIAAGFPTIVAYAVFLFISLGASRIASPSENHSTIKRLVSLGATLLMTVIGSIMATCYRSEEVMFVVVPAIVLTMVAGMDILTEPLPAFPTVVLPFVRRRIKTGHLLYPGWISGVLVYLLLSLMILTLGGIITSSSSMFDADDFIPVLACLLAAPLVPVCIRINHRNLFANWWAVQWILIGSGILLSMFTAMLGERGLATVGVLTPSTTFFAMMAGNSGEMIQAGAVVSALWAIAALVYALNESQHYRKLELEAARMLARREQVQPAAADLNAPAA